VPQGALRKEFCAKNENARDGARPCHLNSETSPIVSARIFTSTNQLGSEEGSFNTLLGRTLAGQDDADAADGCLERPTSGESGSAARM